MQKIIISTGGVTLKDIKDGKAVEISNTSEGAAYVKSFLEDAAEIIESSDSQDVKSICDGICFFFREGNETNITNAGITVFEDKNGEMLLLASVSNLDSTQNKQIYLRLKSKNALYSADYIESVVNKYT